MKVLNTEAGIGGNRKLWDELHPGIEVIAVEINPEIAEIYQSLYPNDKVIIGDAHQYILDHHQDFDFVWCSPTCQSHSKMVKFTRHKVAKYPDMKLYERIIFLQHFFKGKWVVENVTPYYEPLIKPTAKLGRHLLWSNFEISLFEIETPKNFTKLATVEGKKVMMDWLGIHFEKNVYYEGNHCPVQILRNAVHPKLGAHVFNCAFNPELKQPSLFSPQQVVNFKQEGLL